MSLIQGIRKNLLYFSITVPLVLIGYEFLMFLTTSNRGWFFLFIGQIMLVPIVYLTLSFCFTSLFNGTQWGTVFGLVLLLIFSLGIAVAMPFALEATNQI